MTYLTKGLLSRRTEKTLTVSHCGAVYELTDDRASVWEKGRTGSSENMTMSQYSALRELAEQGLAVKCVDSDAKGIYRLMTNCVICSGKRKPLILWNQNERQLWKWLAKAGLKLTLAELVCLNEKRIKPTAQLLGEPNRQALTEAIYTTETISDGILESRMETSPERDSTVQSVMSLLRKNLVFLI